MLRNVLSRKDMGMTGDSGVPASRLLEPRPFRTHTHLHGSQKVKTPGFAYDSVFMFISMVAPAHGAGIHRVSKRLLVY